MKVVIQWSLASPADWVEIDLTPSGRGARAWRDLPRKPLPKGGEAIDNAPGWVYDVNVQGVLLGGHDHYAVEPTAGGGLSVSVWNDDPEDWPAGTRHAQSWTFLPPAPDARFGGAMNTRQSLVRYVEPGAPAPLLMPAETSAGRVQIRPWAEFTPPAEAVTLHGIWLPDGLERAHVDARRRREWREWVA